jgi:hypothetical protein
MKMFFRKCVEKIQVSLKSDKITGTLHENVFSKICWENSSFMKIRQNKGTLHENVFSKICWENSSFMKIRQNNVYFTWKCFQIYDSTSIFFFIIKNVSNKSCRINHNTHFIFQNFLPKTVPFMGQCLKMWWSNRDLRWNYGDALHAV